MSIFNNEQKLKEIVSKNYTFNDVLQQYNLKYTGGNQKTLKKYINRFSIDITHFNTKLSKNLPLCYDSLKDEEIFCLNSKVSSSTAKRRILAKKIFEYICSCGLKGLWNNKPITLQLEHKNGNNTAHRLENLEFLCPNCHSQTATYGRKNKKSPA